MKIAFIGLGAMGAPMAANIAARNVALTVFNREVSKAHSLQQAGARLAESPRAAASGADVICTCVSAPDALREVLLGEGGAIPGADAGALFIDFSTVDPATSREMEATCDAAGCAFVEAPVSGGVGGAKSGTLTIIVGAEPAAFERARPILEMVGESITHVGSVGAGSSIKLINQMLVGVNLAAVLEAFVLGAQAGIDPTTLYDIVRQSSGNSGMLNRAVPGNLIPRKFDPGFTMGLLLKDLRLATEMAGDLGMELAMAAAARTLYEQGVRSGLEARDMTAAVLPIEQRYGVQVSGSES